MLLNVNIFLTIIPILNVFGQKTPSISYISQEQITEIGSSVSLECAVQDAMDYNIEWIKTAIDSYDTLYISVGSGLVLHDSRFSVRFDPSSSKYTLQIKDIQETDAGTYRCRIRLSVANSIIGNVNLQVRRPPIIADNSTQSLVALEGTSVQMECYAAGYPTPIIMWRRMDNAVLPTGGVTYTGNILKIASVRKIDRGTYYCVADNGVSKGDRRNINLEIEFAPVITVLRPTIGQALQYDANLGCHIEAYPTPIIVWIKEDTHLSTNHHYSIAHFSTAEDITDTILRVITIEKSQYGDYYCRATNKFGSAENKINLYETSIPICPPACDTTFNVTESTPDNITTIIN